MVDGHGAEKICAVSVRVLLCGKQEDYGIDALHAEYNHTKVSVTQLWTWRESNIDMYDLCSELPQDKRVLQITHQRPQSFLSNRHRYKFKILRVIVCSSVKLDN